MTGFLRSGLLFAAGGDVFARYGTLTRYTNIPARGGDETIETFTRTSRAWAMGAKGLLVPHAAAVPRLEYGTDPVTGLPRIYLQVEGAAATNVALHNRDLRITHLIGVTGGAGTLIDGETVNASGGGSGIYVVAESTIPSRALRGGTGTFTGTLTGATSGATRTITGSALVWVATNITPTKDQVGVDGVTNAATKLLASAGNATILQTVTLASSARMQSVYIKRITGAGNIQMTTDNGGTWTTITVTAAYTRLSIPSQTVTNPVLGFRIVTNGDAVAVDFVQNETGAVVTSPIDTTNAAVARNGESFTVPWFVRPQANFWIYCDLIESGAVLATAGTFPSPVQIGSFSSWRNLIYYNALAGHYRFDQGNNVVGTVPSTMGADPTVGQRVQLFAYVFSNGTVQLSQSIQGGATVVAAASSALALPSTGFGVNSVQFGATYPTDFHRYGVVKIGRSAGTILTLADAAALPI